MYLDNEAQLPTLLDTPITKRDKIGIIALIAILLLLFGLAGRVENAKAHPLSYDGRACKAHQHHMPRRFCVKLRRLSARRQERRWALRASTAHLISHESSFRWDAVNSSSGACGIGQMLPCQKYGRSYPCWRRDSYQVHCFWRYLRERYGSPDRAWAFWATHRWW